MTDKPKNGSAERELWRRHRPLPESAEPISGFDANLVAAWLEDNLTDEDWPALEARLAAKPAEIETLRAAAGAAARGPPRPCLPALRAQLLALAPTRNPQGASRARRPLPDLARRRMGDGGGGTWSRSRSPASTSAARPAPTARKSSRAAGDNAAGYQVALDTYLPTSSVSFLVEGDSR